MYRPVPRPLMLVFLTRGAGGAKNVETWLAVEFSHRDSLSTGRIANHRLKSAVTIPEKSARCPIADNQVDAAVAVQISRVEVGREI